MTSMNGYALSSLFLCLLVEHSQWDSPLGDLKVGEERGWDTDFPTSVPAGLQNRLFSHTYCSPPVSRQAASRTPTATVTTFWKLNPDFLLQF